MSNPKYYTVNEVADLFRVHRRTVRRWVDRGLVEHIRIGGTIRISSADLVQSNGDRNGSRGRAREYEDREQERLRAALEVLKRELEEGQRCTMPAYRYRPTDIQGDQWWSDLTQLSRDLLAWMDAVSEARP